MGKRLWLPMLLSAALLAMGAGSAFALPSLAGPSGLIALPTAEIAPSNEWQISVGHRSYSTDQMYEASDWSFSGIKGVADDAELWVQLQRVTRGGGSEYWEYGGKYLLSEGLFPRRGFLGGTKIAVGGSVGRWADAIGMHDGELTDVETLRGYLVATKQITPARTAEWQYGDEPGTRIVGSAGLMYLRARLSQGESNTLVRPFIGAQVYGPRGLELLTEYRFKQSEMESDSLFSVGLRKPFGGMILEVGLTNSSPVGLAIDDHHMYVRMVFGIPAEAYQ